MDGGDYLEMYKSGMSIPEVCSTTGIPLSTLRFRLKKEGVLRSRGDGVRSAASRGRLSKNKGIPKPEFSQEWRRKISEGRLRWAEENAKGISYKTDGYAEYTRGESKGRSEHVVVMEKRLGRKLLPDECVHHIDRDRHNNDINNLALVTKSGHGRLHRYEDKISGKQRERNEDGRFS